MRTIAIAASIALITGGGVAGIVVGDTGAQIARDYRAPSGAQANVSTTAMRRPQPPEASADSTPAELRTGDDPAAVQAQPVSVDLNAVFPEDHAAAPAPTPRTAARAPAATLPPAAQRIQAAPTRAVAAPAPQPARVATRTPPPSVMTPAASTVQATPEHVAQPQPQRRRPVRAAARTRPPVRTPSAPVHTTPQPTPAAQPIATAPATTTPAAPLAAEGTRRTTMSQGDGGAAPAAAATTPAGSPPPVTESPSALLANP